MFFMSEQMTKQLYSTALSPLGALKNKGYLQPSLQMYAQSKLQLCLALGCSPPGSLSMAFQATGAGCHFLLPGMPSRIKPASSLLRLPALAGGFFY